MQHGTVSSADRLSQGVIAWPQVRRIPMKTSKKTTKKKNNPKKSAPAAGHGTPSPPRMDTLWGPRAGPEFRAAVAHFGNPDLHLEHLWPETRKCFCFYQFTERLSFHICGGPRLRVRCTVPHRTPHSACADRLPLNHGSISIAAREPTE